MNYYSRLSFAGLLLANSAAFSVNPVMGIYGGLMLDVGRIPGISNYQYVNPFFDSPNPVLAPRPLTLNGTLSYKVFAGGGAQLGYRCDNYRIEGQLLYNNAPYNKLTFHTDVTIDGLPTFPAGTIEFRKGRHIPSFSGSTSFMAGFINGYYDFYLTDSYISPYVGLGIGYSRIQNTGPRFSCSHLHNLCTGFIPFDSVRSVSTSTPVGQAIIGFNYWLDDFSTLALDFRYMSTRTITGLNSGATEFVNGVPTAVSVSNSTRVQAQTLNLVFNYAFDTA